MERYNSMLLVLIIMYNLDKSRLLLLQSEKKSQRLENEDIRLPQHLYATSSFFHDIPSGSGKIFAARQTLSIRSD
jgi:hypothetical protein